MAKKFIVEVSEDLSVTDVWMAIHEYTNFMMETGELEEYINVDVGEVE